MLKLNNFIGSEFTAPHGENYLESFDPSSGSVYALVPDSSDADIDAAVMAADTAFPAWSGLGREERARILYRIADGIERRLEEFAAAESRDQGKPVKLARTMDIPRAVANFRFFAGAILHQEERATDMDGKALNYTLRTPLGVAGLITPWNLPLYLLTWKIAPALATGNTVVCKPSEITSVTAHLLAGVMIEAGLPTGVCNFVFGRGPTAGQALVTHPRVPLISFTGGSATGEHLIRSSAPRFKKLSLELGGKNPNIIFSDADFDECVSTSIRSSFLNQGEICLCGSRIFVQHDIYEKFLGAFVSKAERLVVGDPTSEATDLGPLVSREHFEKVRSYVEVAKQEGGKIECGGNVPALEARFQKGYFLRPTVVTGLLPSSRVMQEEIFGPVVTVTPFRTETELVEYANGTRYGLSASIWTRDLSRAHRVARQVRAGTVWINTWLNRDLRVPFGGTKASGIGREGGDHSLDFYTEQKNVCLKI